MLGVDSNASQAALVNFEDGVESGPASAPALIYSDVMGHMFPGSDKWKLGGSGSNHPADKCRSRADSSPVR